MTRFRGFIRSSSVYESVLELSSSSVAFITYDMQYRFQIQCPSGSRMGLFC